MVSSIDRTKRDRYSAKGQEINKRVKERKRKRERERERERVLRERERNNRIEEK